MKNEFDRINDKHWLLNINKTPNPLDATNTALIIASFDSETEKDIEMLENQKVQIKLIKKTALLKLVLFVPEYLLSFMFLGKKQRKHKVEVHKVYFSLLFNKITFEEFIFKLQSVLNKGIIY